MKYLFVVIILVLVFFILPTSVEAQGLLPDFFQNLLDTGRGRASSFATSRIQVMLLLVLGVIVIAAVFYAFLAGWKYIRSQGDQGQIDEATKAIQAIFMGLGALLVSIVGIVLVFVFFGANLFNTGLYQSCISAPNSIGCVSCNEPDGGLPANWEELKFTEKNPEVDAAERVSKGSSWGPGTDIVSQQLCVFCEYEYFQSKDDETFKNQKIADIVCKG